MKKITLLILTCFVSSAFAQGVYQRQQSAGEIPDDLKLSIKQKIEKDKQEFETVNNSMSKDEKKFIINTNRNIDELLQSGKILFGDEMTVYITKLAKLILEKNNQTELIDKLRFYTVKSSIVNAFTTHQGMIFVNVGLLAQVENESQLAFILSHEIAHYIQNHVLQSHKNTLEYINSNSSKEYDQVITELSSYSKSQEFESDSIGYLMYTKAGYNPEDAEKAMNVLQYAHLPFDEIPMDLDYFDRDTYKLNLNKLFTDKLMNYKDISDKDDSRSTHPNIKSRKQKMAKLASFESKFVIKNEYLLSKEEFEKVQRIARLDNLKNNLTSRNYIKVVYESFLLKRKYPNESYIDDCLAKALYAISKLKTNSQMSALIDSDDYEGEISKLANLFTNQLTDYEINILALKHLISLPKNENNKKYEDDLIYDLVNNIGFDITRFHQSLPNKDFEDTTLVEVKDVFNELDSIAISELTKIERILYFQKLKKSKEKQNIVVTEKEDDYYLNAFVNEMKDSEFSARFDIKEEGKEEKTNEFVSIFSKKETKLELENPIDGLIIVEPFLVSSSDKNGTDKEESEKRSNELQVVLGDVVSKLDLNAVIASREANTTNDLKTYNGEAAIKEWVYQYSTFATYKIIPLNTEEVNTYTEDNNASYVLLTAIYTNKGTPIYGMLYTTLSTLALYPVLPFMIYQNFTPRYHNDFYTQVIDIKSNKMVLNNWDKTNKKIKEFNIRSILYYNLYQLKQ